jgi:2-aminobenzoate-CoA ligase
MTSASSEQTTQPPRTGAASAHASITVQRRIEWSDTDASGYWHNTAAFRWIEVAETALLDRLGLLDEIYGRLPRVQISAQFTKALRLKDLVDIELFVVDVGRTSITYHFRMACGGEIAAEGRATAVLLDRATRQPEPWSDDHRRLLLESGPQPGEMLTSG